jgi:gamma-glutamylcyclotransferase (GGCT)/AIG2-like uncharacterized protein YtfP
LLTAQEATVRGRLYQMPAPYPALVVPQADILALGAADVLADLRTQARGAAEVAPPTEDVVHGELFTFDDAAERLSHMDDLEGFEPGRPSLYLRVLVPVWTADGVAGVAWTYHYPGATESLQWLRAGRWDDER